MEKGVKYTIYILLWKEAFLLASKMIDDIRKAEAEGETLKEEARLKAKEILEQAAIQSSKNAQDIITQAKHQAEDIIANAKAETSTETEKAKADSENIKKSIADKALQNADAAINAAVKILGN